MKVVILAGGFGSRISEESYLKPKPLIEIGGKPILWHIMKIYSSYGFNEFIICAGYKGNLIKDYFNKLQMYENDVTFEYTINNSKILYETNNNLNWKVTVVDTGLNTMTGGRVKRIEKYIGNDEEFMLTYGDGVGDININELIKTHNQSNNIGTVTGFRPLGRFGVMRLDKDKVCEFKEKVSAEDDWISAGFFVFNKKIFQYIKGDDTILEKEPLIKIASEGALGVYRHEGFWQPMDTLKEKDYLESLWNSNKAPWNLWNK